LRLISVVSSRTESDRHEPTARTSNVCAGCERIVPSLDKVQILESCAPRVPIVNDPAICPSVSVLRHFPRDVDRWVPTLPYRFSPAQHCGLYLTEGRA